MKRKISGILFGLMFLLGFAILIYPTVSNQWNTYRQNQLISSYEELIGKMAEEDFTKEWEKANAFNDTIIHNNIFGDVFGENGDDIKNTEYWQILNVGNDGVMGYVSIPKINVKLSIYHGTADDVLQTGISLLFHVLFLLSYSSTRYSQSTLLPALFILFINFINQSMHFFF